MRTLSTKESSELFGGGAIHRYQKQVAKCARGFSKHACNRAARMKARHKF
jgi:hypothetical protein